MDRLEFSLLNDFQRGFPLVPAPWREIAARLASDERTVLAALGRLAGAGAVSRVGGVFAPGRVGASTLAALAAPPDRLAELAGRVSAHAGVNHNYEREHRLNLWFVVTAADALALAATLAAIAADTGCEVIALPLEEEFHIDLGFCLRGGAKAPTARRGAAAGVVLPDWAPRLVAALEGGLDLVPRPFGRIAMKAGLTESAVLAAIAGWLADGLLRRFGVVVRHHELGYTANAMSVWNVPDDAVAGVGARLAAEPGVTLCYRRRRAGAAWPYNLYCMVHGRARDEVRRRIAELNVAHGLAGHAHALLFSRRRFKQCGARYFAERERSHG